MDTHLHFKLVHAVTEYDRKQSTRRGYNIWALPQYLGACEAAEADIAAGKPLRKAIVSNFCGRLLDAVLKAVGESKATDLEQR
jgi:hypothetical protein